MLFHYLLIIGEFSFTICLRFLKLTDNAIVYRTEQSLTTYTPYITALVKGKNCLNFKKIYLNSSLSTKMF